MGNAVRRVEFVIMILSLIVGILLITSVVGTAMWSVPHDTGVATVNEWQLRSPLFEAAARKVGAVTPAARSGLLRYLIDEELLVQRALEIGLLGDDQQLHRLVVRQAIDGITRNAASIVPSSNDLANFSPTYQGVLNGPCKLTMRVATFQTKPSSYLARDNASEMQRLIQSGTPFELAAQRTYGTIVHGFDQRPTSQLELEMVLGADRAADIMRRRKDDIAIVATPNGTPYVIAVTGVTCGTGVVDGVTGPSVVRAFRSRRATDDLVRAVSVQRSFTRVWVAPMFPDSTGSPPSR
jgi:hypothetical protein